ncbi:MAG: nitrilase-related carbon-nitrogen hydrolase [Gammaproteobacteria bacterium]
MWRAALSKHEYINLILLQYQPLDNVSDNISKIELLLKKNNVNENTLVVCPELSLQRYVCITKTKKNISNAISLDSEEISLIKNIAIKYRIFLCITIFEKLKKKYFNTALIINPEGNIIKKYHKKNIPSEICYEESYYFNKSNNGYQFFSIGVFKIGILICWDQWHSSAYLELKKKDVNLIICPTAIGTCFYKNEKIQIANEKKKWINVIEANSLMNNIPIVVANRIGTEQQKDSSIKFWGSSFITDAHGTSLKRCKLKQGIIKYRFYKKDQISIKKMWNFQDIG